MGIGRTCGEESLQELSCVNILPACGLDQTGKNAMVLHAGFRSCSKGSFPEDHEMADRLFRMIVCRRHARMPQKRKDVFLILTGKISPERFRRF